MTIYALLLARHEFTEEIKIILYLPQSSFQIVIQFFQVLTLNLSQNIIFVGTPKNKTSQNLK